MRRVIVESPYSAPTPEGIAENETYARRCLADCLKRGEAPIASHLLLTQPGVLNDADPAERFLGMRAGWAWTRVADAVVVYMDRGESRGMKQGVEWAHQIEVPVEFRYLDGEPG